jgi:hypothetical protein
MPVLEPTCLRFSGPGISEKVQFMDLPPSLERRKLEFPDF